MTIKVFIADDHQLILDGLMEMLDKEASIEVIGSARDGAEAIEKISILRPDLVLLDLDMPEKNGFAVLEEVRKSHPAIRFIILSMHLERALLEKAIKLGVEGYLAKTANKNELVSAIQSVHSGTKHYAAEVAIGLASNKKDADGTSSFLVDQLSPREKEVLKELAEGKTNKEISEQLNISHFTVETHRKHIMRKLDAHTVADLIRVAFKSGLVE